MGFRADFLNLAKMFESGMGARRCRNYVGKIPSDERRGMSLIQERSAEPERCVGTFGRMGRCKLCARGTLIILDGNVQRGCALLH